MIHSLEAKIFIVKAYFKNCATQEAIYQHLMETGKALPLFNPLYKTESYRVPGCQSLMYLHAEQKEGRLYFSASSDALISAGLAALLITVYSGETAETIIKSPPSFLEELGLLTSLSPSRVNGLASLHLRMKQEALKALSPLA